jgi:hypothetical protein
VGKFLTPYDIKRNSKPVSYKVIKVLNANGKTGKKAGGSCGEGEKWKGGTTVKLCVSLKNYNSFE